MTTSDSEPVPGPLPPPPPDPEPDGPFPPGSAGNYVWRYAINALLALLTIIAAAGNIVTTNPEMAASGAWLGLSDVQWHWVLLASGVAMAVYNSFIRTPTITKYPTKDRLAIEREVWDLRNELERRTELEKKAKEEAAKADQSVPEKTEG